MNPPGSLGLCMPAEWEPHEATWLAWPKNPETFPAGILPRVEDSFCEIVAAISRGEKAKLLIDDMGLLSQIEKMLTEKGANISNVEFRCIRTSDVWVRDYGPTFVIESKTNRVAAVKWKFNAWGGKYDDLLHDDEAGEKIAKMSDCEIFRPGIFLEGGSIDVNGRGALLTTEQCLLNKNRNPDLARVDIEVVLKDHLSVDNIIWLGKGIEGDDTDGHIDDIARFASEKAVLCAYSNKADADGYALRKNYEMLKDRSDFEVCKLPMPDRIIDAHDGRTLPATYANFYICNSSVLVPAFGTPKDRVATDLIEGFFPNREILRIRCNELVFGYGAIHCITQQVPKIRD
ncbi:MAG: agmatine deiminase family protein [Candidatus Micrarchaeota archaeon]